MGVFKLFLPHPKNSDVWKLTLLLGAGQLSPQPEPAVAAVRDNRL